jgi:hypothetical protein
MVAGLFQHVSEEKRRQAFERFHADNPHVYAEFERRALLLINSGRTRYSARTIIEAIRWHFDSTTTSEDGFKINDHHSALYARMFAARHKQHGTFFTMKGEK